LIQNTDGSDLDKLEGYKSDNTNKGFLSSSKSDLKPKQLEIIESYVENYMSSFIDNDQKPIFNTP